VLWGDKIFVTTADTNSSDWFLLCINAADGRVVWQRNFPWSSYHIHEQNSFATSTPATDGERVYVASATPEKYVLRALTLDGKDAWHVEFGAFNSQHGFASSPIVYDDLVIIGDEQDGPHPEGPAPRRGPGSPPPSASEYDGKSFLVALDRATGKERWHRPRVSTVVTYATPCVYKTSGHAPELIFDSESHGISGIDPKTGRVNWELPLFDRRAVGSPIVVGDLVLGACGVGSGNNTLFAVHPGDSKHKATVAYTVDKSMASYVPTPVAKGSLVFICSDRGVISCIDGATGKQHWHERVGGNFSSSPVRAGDKIFCTSADGEVVVVAASDKYELLARNPLNETCRSTPAIANGHMYIRTESHLYSIGGK
jgi:outer membrane protein assembly factor BamB